MRIEIERELNQVVAKVGGRRVDEIVGMSPTFRNADYVFPDEPCIAELKCLDKDQLPDFPGKVNELLNGWIEDGVIPPPPPGRSTIETKNLPIECQRKLAHFYRKPVVDILDHANRQIRDTKEHLGMPNSPGLLLLANNCNMLLDRENLFYSLASALAPPWTGQRRYSSINRIVYFTANLPMVGPNPNMDYHVWIPLQIDKDDDCMISLTTRLGKEWIAHCERLVGQPITVEESTTESLKSLRLRRPWDSH